MTTITKWLIAGTFIVWILWDVVLAKNNSPTESMVITQFARTHTILPYLIGFICGHWFWTRKTTWKSGWMWALPVFLGLIVWDYFWNKSGGEVVWFRHPVLWLPIGIVSGSYLWGQSDDRSPL